MSALDAALLTLSTDASGPPERTAVLIDRMLDWRMLNPAGKWAVCALLLNCQASTLYRLAATDLFKRRYAERRARVEDAVVVEVLEQTQALAQQSLDKVSQELESGAASADFALRAFDLATKMLGIGKQNEPGASNRGVSAGRGPSVHFVVQATLADARAAMAAQRELDFNTASQRAVVQNISGDTSHAGQFSSA